MAIDEKRLTQYYQLKKAKVLLDQKLDDLGKKIKEDLEPGEHQIGNYKVVVTLKRRFDLDTFAAYDVLPPDLYKDCLKQEIDPSLLESAYLRGEITDDLMRVIRGPAKIIPSLTIERIENV